MEIDGIKPTSFVFEQNSLSSFVDLPQTSVQPTPETNLLQPSLISLTGELAQIGELTQQGNAAKVNLLALLQQNDAAANKTVVSDNPLGFLLSPAKNDLESAGSFRAGGAFFNKQMAVEPGPYVGIEQRVKLPTITTDPNRFYVSRSGGDVLSRITDFRTSPLDKPSVYLGGSTSINSKVKGEMDVGLTYDRVYDKNGQATFTTNPAGSDMRNSDDRFTIAKAGNDYVVKNEAGAVVARAPQKDVDAQINQNLQPLKDGSNREPVLKIGDYELRPNYAFRPTERTINLDPTTKRTINKWDNPPVKSNPADPAGNKYFYPGETVNLSVKVVGKDLAQLAVSVEGSTNPEDQYRHSFTQQGLGNGKAWQPKTVISIDQFTVDSNGNRRGTEFTGTPNLKAENRDGDNKLLGIYAQGVKPTSAKLENAVVYSSTLLVKDKSGKVTGKPVAGNEFYEVRSNELRNRNYTGIFQVRDAQQQTGGRVLSITPANIKNVQK